jgi:hypothetical protein
MTSSSLTILAYLLVCDWVCWGVRCRVWVVERRARYVELLGLETDAMMQFNFYDEPLARDRGSTERPHRCCERRQTSQHHYADFAFHLLSTHFLCDQKI